MADHDHSHTEAEKHYNKMKQFTWLTDPQDGSIAKSFFPYKASELRRGDVSYPEPFVVPNVRYVNTSTPPFSTEERPYTCPATDLLKLNHLSNPMMIFGQPFSGKTGIIMKLTTQAHAHYGQRHWIRFVDLRVAAENCISSGKWPTDITVLLSDQLHVCLPTLRHLFKPLANAKELVRKKKFDKLVRGELFLDGFDEIPIAEREYFLKLLPQLVKKREDCPIRVWITSRTYFKARLLNLLGDESAFDIMDYDVDLQKNLLFNRWKILLFPDKIKKYEEDRLWDYTHEIHKALCTGIKDFETTFGTCPFYLLTVCNMLTTHISSFFALYTKLRDGKRAGVKENSGKSEPASSSGTKLGRKGRNKKKKVAKKQAEKRSSSSSSSVEGDEEDCVSATTAEILCQITAMFVAEFFEYVALAVLDIYCLKFHYNREMTQEEFQAMVTREYQRAIHLYAEYTLKTFPSFHYETLVPLNDSSEQMIPNLSLIVDEELHHVGFMVMGEKDGVVELRNKILGHYFLAKHFASEYQTDIRDTNFDSFYLRRLLFEPEVKTARSLFDNILHINEGHDGPEVLRQFLVSQYRLEPEDENEWELVRDGGTCWHLAVMEGFCNTALTMTGCFDPITDREYVRKLLRIRVPMQIYEGARSGATTCLVNGGFRNGTHLVSSLSVIAMFGYGVGMEELLKRYKLFFTPEEIRDELSAAGTWTPMHYAAMHSNLWFLMIIYNEEFLPKNMQPPAGMYNPLGQLPIHVSMSYSWHHVLILKDYFFPEYDTVSRSFSLACRKSPVKPGHENAEDWKHCHTRELTSYRDMIKDVQGPQNEMLRRVHHHCIKLMTKFGRDDINAPERSTGNTLLHYAAADGCLDTVQFLLENGASVQPKNLDGRTPLHFAGLHGHRGIFMCLVKRGAAATTNKENDVLSPIYLWSRFGSHIDKAKQGPMSMEEKHFFQTCKDLDNIMKETNAREKAQEEEKGCGIDTSLAGIQEEEIDEAEKQYKKEVAEYLLERFGKCIVSEENPAFVEDVEDKNNNNLKEDNEVGEENISEEDNQDDEDFDEDDDEIDEGIQEQEDGEAATAM